MSYRTAAFLAVVAAALTTYAWIWESGAPAWEGAGRVFPDVGPDDIVRIEIRRRAGAAEKESGARDAPIVLERRGDFAWWIVEPIAYQGFLPRIQGVLWEIADLVKVLEVGPDDPAYSSWAPPEGPELTLRFRTRAGGEHMIEIGERHPALERDLYARIDGERGTVIVTRASVRNAFDVTLEEVRSRALVPVAPQDCVHFSVRGPEEARKTLVREGPGAAWRFGDADPLAGSLADRLLVDELLAELNAWTVVSFEDGLSKDPARWSAAGLAAPRIVVECRHARGERVVLEIGNSLKRNGAELVYARHAGSEFALTAKAEVLESVLASPERLRTRFVFDFAGEEVVKLACRAGDREFVVRREKSPAGGDGAASLGGETWTVEDIARGEEFPADRLLLGEALAEVRELLIEKFLETSEPGAQGAGAFIAGRHAGAVTVTLESGRELTVVFEERSGDPRDAGVEAYLASRSTDPSRFLVVSRWPSRLREGGYVFRDRTLSRLDPGNVAGLRVVRGDRSWDIAYLNREWSFSSEQHVVEGRELDQALLGRLVQVLHEERFRARSFAPDLPKSHYEALGIGTHRSHLELHLTAFYGPHEGFTRLTFGPRQTIDGEANLHYARADTVPVPFIVSSGVPDLLRQVADHLAWVAGEP